MCTKRAQVLPLWDRGRAAPVAAPAALCSVAGLRAQSYHRAEQSKLTKSHLCGLKLKESANWKRKRQKLLQILLRIIQFFFFFNGGHWEGRKSCVAPWRKAGRRGSFEMQKSNTLPSAGRAQWQQPPLHGRETHLHLLISPPHLSALLLCYNILFYTTQMQ